MKLNSASEEKYSNYVKSNRGWVTFRHHLPTILKPTAVGLLAIAAWYFLVHTTHLHFTEHSNEPILFIVLPLVGFIYVIFASVAITSVFNQYKTVSKAVVKKDLSTFLLYRDEQLPIMMHILIAAPSVIIILFVMLYDYHSDTAMAMASIFAVTFVLVLIWNIATELDDFSKSIWFKEKIPKEWYKIDVEKYFQDQIKQG